MSPILINALRETLYMVITASIFTILCGIPLGVFVANIAATHSKPIKGIFHAAYYILQSARAIPYLLLMLLFLPLTNWLINQGISYTSATIIPLSVAGSLLLARKVYSIMYDLSVQWLATGKAMGASPKQTLWLILIPEGMADIIRASAYTCSLIVGFSAIAGALGAGGLGQFAIEKSISDPEPFYVLLSVVILVALQQLITYAGTLVLQQTKPR